jgi:hypothetical protein
VKEDLGILKGASIKDFNASSLRVNLAFALSMTRLVKIMDHDLQVQKEQ